MPRHVAPSRSVRPAEAAGSPTQRTADNREGGIPAVCPAPWRTLSGTPRSSAVLRASLTNAATAQTSRRSARCSSRDAARMIRNNATESRPPRSSRGGMRRAFPPLRWILPAQHALRLHVHRIDRLARRHEQPVPLHTPEAQVGAAFGQQDAADQLAVGREYRDAVLALATGEAAPDIALGVA